MNEEVIEGRDLIKDGSFSDDWKDSWTHDETGAVLRRHDDDNNTYYLMLNGSALVTQTIQTAVLTDAQLKGATYQLAFRYENYGSGKDAGVFVETEEAGHQFFDLSGIPAKQPLADWNFFDPEKIKGVVATDKCMTIGLQGTETGGVAGLRIADVNLQLHLVPLQLQSIQLDDRVYRTA